MTHADGGQAAQRRGIRIRVSGDDARDLGALHRWLSREEWFAQAEERDQLEVAYRERNGTERVIDADQVGPPMGGGILELVLVITGVAIAPVFEDLYAHAKVAVRAWAANITSSGRSVEADVQRDDDGGGDTDAEDDESER
jgi:hypothetical protein